jgi:hypothetical protein
MVAGWSRAATMHETLKETDLHESKLKIERRRVTWVNGPSGHHTAPPGPLKRTGVFRAVTRPLSLLIIKYQSHSSDSMALLQA